MMSNTIIPTVETAATVNLECHTLTEQLFISE